MDITAIGVELRKRENRAAILLAVVAFHVPLLLGLSSRRRRSGNRVLRSLHWGVSATYFPLMTYVLSFLTAYIPSAGSQATSVLVVVILVQFLRAKADMAALAVAAVASPAAGDDDVNGLKIRPSAQSFINTFWVAGLVLYNIFTTCLKKQKPSPLSPAPSPSTNTHWNDELNRAVLIAVMVLISPLWAHLVLAGRWSGSPPSRGRRAPSRSAATCSSSTATCCSSGKKAAACFVESEMAAQPQPQFPVPRLIVTGQRDDDVVESPLGYHVKRSSLQGGEGSRLVTLDRVWSSDSDDCRLEQQDKDLCLSFALFKCLRRRFAGYPLAAEAALAGRSVSSATGCSVAVFRVIATELSFVSPAHKALCIWVSFPPKSPS